MSKPATVAGQIAAIIRERDALKAVMATWATAARITQAKLDQAKTKLAAMVEENKALKAEVRQLRRQMASISAQLATPVEEKPKAVRKPRQRKAIAPPLSVIIEEVSEEEANADIWVK